MARPGFTPDEAQRRLIAALTRLGARQRRLTDETDRVIADANAAGIPVLHIAKALGRQRKTVYRHLGRKMP